MITERIDAITKIPPAYRSMVCPAPKSVKIELSPKCNFRCGFCALRTREKALTKPMDMDLFKRITKDMRESGVEEIGVFYLGESFTAPENLIEGVRYLKQDISMPYVFLTSNASLAKPEYVDAVMAAGLDSLKWSVNAADEDQFTKIMGVSERLHEKALQYIKEAFRVRERGGYKCGLYASSILYDDEQRGRMGAVLNDITRYVDKHYWLPLYSMGAFASQREAELGYRPTAGNQGRLDNLREPLPCWSAFTEGHVRADGGLSACCFDAGGNWIMGDLTEQTFMEAWNSQKFQDLRAAHLLKDVMGTICEKCVAY